MYKPVWTLTVALLLALIAGCGFHLQGALIAPTEMERTFIATDDRRSAFYRLFQAELRAAGVNVVDTATDATAVFTISFDETDQRVLSVSARNVPTEYEVFYTIQYDLVAGSKNMLETQTLTLTRDYTYDSTLVLGKAREEALLREAIVADLVRTVLKQIATL